MKDYYDILGVSEDASNEQIKKAFKEIAKKEHPDRGGNEARFKEANEAYDTLKNSQKRHDYDTMRKFGATQGGGQHPFFNEDIFGDLFQVSETEIWTLVVDLISRKDLAGHELLEHSNVGIETCK